MSDKEFTDEEIITGLECCISTTTNEACVECPFNKQKLCDKDQWALERYALDLINRQKSEIERLKGWQDVLKAEKHSLIKYTAYKEFAKFLIDKASKGLIHVSDLPDFVKEMVGEEK